MNIFSKSVKCQTIVKVGREGQTTAKEMYSSKGYVHSPQCVYVSLGGGKGTHTENSLWEQLPLNQRVAPKPRVPTTTSREQVAYYCDKNHRLHALDEGHCYHCKGFTTECASFTTPLLVKLPISWQIWQLKIQSLQLRWLHGQSIFSCLRKWSNQLSSTSSMNLE
jgi:hypothetical protein